MSGEHLKALWDKLENEARQDLKQLLARGIRDREHLSEILGTTREWIDKELDK
jgi:hypothetical protein